MLPRENTTFGKIPLWSAVGKSVVPPPVAAPLPCVPEPFPGAGEGIRTPDPLITNQMLYQLSYASR